MKQKRKYILIVLAILVWISIWSSALIFSLSHPENKNSDLWDALNSLFGGLGIIGLIFTILLQRNDLKINTRELRLNRKQFIQQNKTLASQRFESTFFNLLNSHINLVNTFSLIGESGRVVGIGRQIFDFFIADLTKLLDTEEEHPLSYYQELYNEKLHPILDSYLRSLAAILDYIETNGLISDEQKERYYYFVLAQLNFNEQALLEHHIKLMYVTEVEPGYPNRDANFIERIRELLKNNGDTQLGRHNFNWMYDYKIKFKRKVNYEFDRLPLTK